MKLRKLWVGAAVALGLLAGSGPARALPLAGDQTIVLLTAADFLAGAGFSVSGLGTATIALDIVSRPEASFPITGGDVTGLAGTIEHDGSGLRLDLAGTQLDLENFLIDTNVLQLFGDASLNGSPIANIPIFDIGLCTSLAGTADECVDGDGSILLDGFKLSLTSDAAGALEQIFMLGVDLTGTQIGVARIDIRPVPEPGTALLLGLGLGGAALTRRHRSGAPRA